MMIVIGLDDMNLYKDDISEKGDDDHSDCHLDRGILQLVSECTE